MHPLMCEYLLIILIFVYWFYVYVSNDKYSKEVQIH